uniref:Uncharacterized protein n=1 Tax=Cacopsylla melanoneura TaxID=428564 RepID=A0A8D8QI17_9HEMI
MHLDHFCYYASSYSGTCLFHHHKNSRGCSLCRQDISVGSLFSQCIHPNILRCALLAAISNHSRNVQLYTNLCLELHGLIDYHSVTCFGHSVSTGQSATAESKRKSITKYCLETSKRDIQ